MSTTPRDARAAVPQVPTPASRPTETARVQERRPAPRPEIVEPRVPGEGSRVEPTRMTGSEGIIRSLEELGVTDVFGLPGGAILPTYDPLMDSDRIRHILVRHEQGAGHAAQGYHLATGKVGVAIATSGPGATNLVTAIADAHMDSQAVVFITGQVSSAAIGTDAFQEADIVGITMPITKHSRLVTRPEDVPQALAEAFHIAATGRPGPVLVDVTKDAQQGEFEFAWPPRIDLPGYRPVLRGHPRQIREAARLIREARRPVLSVAALQQADLLITLGARFDDRVTGHLPSFAPGARVIHADIDPAEISKNRTADVPIVGHVKEIIPDLVAELATDTEALPDLADWWAVLRRLQETYPMGWTETEDGLLAPQEVISRLSALSGPEATYVAGVGQHQMWASQFVAYERPRQWLNSAGLGTMGFAVPAAMGAQVGEPDRVVWAIDGDGCFQMTNQELATCVINRIPIKIAVINNSSLGMVRQWQTLFYDGRYSNTDLNTGHDTARVPDFVKLADAYGAAGLRCDRREDLDDTIRQALAIDDRPVIVDFVVSRDAMVWPMVPAGVSNDAIQVARGMTPDWDQED